MIRLEDLKAGECATIESVALEGQIKLRFTELGVTKGTEVVFIKKAPLGDPYEVEIRGYRLCLRKEEARLIFVKDVKKAVTE